MFLSSLFFFFFLLLLFVCVCGWVEGGEEREAKGGQKREHRLIFFLSLTPTPCHLKLVNSGIFFLCSLVVVLKTSPPLPPPLPPCLCLVPCACFFSLSRRHTQAKQALHCRLSLLVIPTDTHHYTKQTPFFRRCCSCALLLLFHLKNNNL